MNRKPIALLALFCLISIANGTTLPPVHIDRLFKEADLVFVVQISDGKTLESSGNQCGAIYTGKVVESIKGEADTISFGHFHGYEIGSTYLLFLTEPYEFKEAAKVASRYVVLPDAIPTRGYIPNEAERFQEYVWVLAPDLFEYLKTLE